MMDLEPSLADSWEPHNSYSSYTNSCDYFSLQPQTIPDDSLIDFPINDTTSKKRGRKPLRPNDPIRKKTEEKDKYWLRAFRAYMKSHIAELKKQLSPSDLKWWKFYLSADGKPGKGHRFLSYGKIYKNYIFSQSTFVDFFRGWFIEFGETELQKKCTPGTDLWFVFFDYAQNELFNYFGADGPTGKTLVLPSNPEERQDTQEETEVQVDSFFR
jgi:hypothetical protein